MKDTPLTFEVDRSYWNGFSRFTYKGVAPLTHDLIFENQKGHKVHMGDEMIEINFRDQRSSYKKRMQNQ